MKSDYVNDEQFLIDLNNAHGGCQKSLSNIWNKMTSKQSRKYAEKGLAYITLIEAVGSYKQDKLPKGKNHTWQFAAFFSQRMRKQLQLEKFRMHYPMTTTQYQWEKGQLPQVHEFDGKLADNCQEKNEWYVNDREGEEYDSWI